MRRHRFLTDLGLRTFLLLGGAASCSFLYDLDKVQCEVEADCFNVGFDNTTVECRDNICFEPKDNVSTGGNGNTTNNNNTSNTSGGSGGTGGSDGTGGGSGGGDGGTGGDSSTTSTNTGTGGAGGAPGCQDNAECIEELDGNAAICRDGDCISLITDECPFVLDGTNDLANLKKPSPILFGAYADINPVTPKLSALTSNYELAIKEINQESNGGLTGGPGGTRRPFVAVVCDGFGGTTLTSMDHLIQEVKVPGIITALLSSDLLEAFEQKAKPNNVFLLSPYDADSSLTNTVSVDPDGLMWHLLPAAADLAPAYKPLLARTEALIRDQQSIPTEEDIRVALVVADIPFLQDIATYFKANVRFNNKAITENGTNFKQITIDSSYEVASPNLIAARSALQEFLPHIVVALASEEFTFQDLLPSLENSWDLYTDTIEGMEDLPPPFYLLSPYLYVPAMLSRASSYEDPPGDGPETPLRERLLGVNAAAAQDRTLYDLYLVDLLSEYGDDGLQLAGTENYYDAAYFMMYSIVASRTQSPTGLGLSDGMKKLLGGSQLIYNVGRDHVGDVIDDLSLGRQITLNGTLGPPDFDQGAGARRGLPSIFCIDHEGGASTPMQFFPDVLTYDPDTEEIEEGQPCSIAGF